MLNLMISAACAARKRPSPASVEVSNEHGKEIKALTTVDSSTWCDNR
jgi:hypothetical protein